MGKAASYRFISLDKGDFIGRAALVAKQKRGTARRIATLSIEDGRCERVRLRGRLPRRRARRSRHVGRLLHTFGHDIALAVLPLELVMPGTELEVSILGERRAAKVIADSPYDPEGARGRM